MNPLLQALTCVAIIGSAAVAGAFFTFSNFTMSGLRRLPPQQGAAAMQAINKEAPSPLFMLLLFGTGIICVVLLVAATRGLSAPGAKYQLAASGFYLLGVVAMTVVFHVPRNNALDALDPRTAEGIAYWGLYLKEWVAMNHVRTLAPLLAAGLFLQSLRG